MEMLDFIGKLNKRIELVGYEETECLKKLENYSKKVGIGIPEDYRKILGLGADMEMLVGDEGYIRVWGAEGCVEMNEIYYIQEDIPVSLAIADDGGGGCLVYLEGNEGYGLYYLRYEDLDVDEATYIAPNLTDVIFKGEGIDMWVKGGEN